VGFVIEELRNKARVEIENVLNGLPTGLEEMYERMLLQISEDRRNTAAIILRWVAVVFRPLTLAELGAATGIRPVVNMSFDDVMRDHVGFCGYLLTVTGSIVNLVY
jgi:hypothetical protein